MPDATANLSVLVAETTVRTASSNMAVAETYGATASISPAVAATYGPAVDTDVAVAEPRSSSVWLDVFRSGSIYLTPTLRVIVAAPYERTTDADVAVADPLSQTATLSIAVSDAAPILLEQDAPKSAPIASAADFVLSVHPNAIASASSDFVAAGVQPGDVLELLDGANRGNYLVVQVAATVLFVSEAFAVTVATGPFAGQIRTKQAVSAVKTAALVLDRALLLAPLTVSCTVDVAVA